MLYETVFIFSGQLTPKSAEQNLTTASKKLQKKRRKNFKTRILGTPFFVLQNKKIKRLLLFNK